MISAATYRKLYTGNKNNLTVIFFPGDADENVYVVQTGRLNVFIRSTDGSILSLKVVKAGESVTSLLSFTDVLTVRKTPLLSLKKKIIIINLNET